jgi:hypothetical protein
MSLNQRQNNDDRKGNGDGNGVENSTSIPECISLQYSSTDLLQSLGNSNGASLHTGSSSDAPLPSTQTLGNSNGASPGSSNLLQSLGNSNGAALHTGSSGDVPPHVNSNGGSLGSSNLLQSLGNSNGVSLHTGSSSSDVALPGIRSLGNSNGASLHTGSSGTAPLPFVQTLGKSNGASLLTGGSGDVPLPPIQNLGNSNGASLLTGGSGALSVPFAHRHEKSNGISLLTASSSAVPIPVLQHLGNLNGVSRLTGSSGAVPNPAIFLPAFAPSQIPASISLPYHLVSTPTTNQPLQYTVSFGMPAAAAKSQLPTIPAAGQYCRILYLSEDDDSVSPYQCLVRKQIEVFQATESYLREKKQGRNKPIILCQIGIRCRHCGKLPGNERAKGAVFFPSQLDGLYQTGQNMANKHLLHDCREIPTDIREDLFRIRLKEKGVKTRKSAYGGGRKYWADGLRVLGVVESPDRRLRLVSVAS